MWVVVCTLEVVLATVIFMDMDYSAVGVLLAYLYVYNLLSWNSMQIVINPFSSSRYPERQTPPSTPSSMARWTDWVI